MREVVYDPAFFARSAELLSARGLTVASLDQRSAPMREAWSQFYEAVNAGALAHEGDAILTAHVLNAAAHVDPSGHWKVRKIKQSHKIDGLVASRDRLLPRCTSSGQADGRVRLGLGLGLPPRAFARRRHRGLCGEGNALVGARASRAIRICCPRKRPPRPPEDV